MVHTPECSSRYSRRGPQTAIFVIIAALFTGITVGVILTRGPWWDEGQLADPAHTLAQAGYLGSRVMTGTGHPSVREFVAYNRYTYWTLPLYLVVMAGWIKLIGFSIVKVRMLSLIFGAALVCAGAVLTRRTTKSRLAGLLAALFLSTDYTLVLSAATVRMDIMAAALGFGAIAAYVALRESNIRAACFAGGFLAAAACLTHPVGAMHTGGLILTAVFLDYKRLKWTHIALAAIPYFVMAALWGIYIAEAPAIFISQFHAHAKYRLAGFSSPLRAIFDDVLSRYINFFTPEGPPGSKLKLGILIVYWTGIALAALVPALRRAPGVLLLLLLSGLYYTELALLDGAQFPHYMVHVISVWALLLAAISGVAISRKLIPVPILVGVLAVFVLLQISGHAIKIRHNTYHTDYLPTIAFVQQHSDSQTLVMGPSQLQFGLSGRTLVDDARLGGLSGLSPGLIVLDQAHPGAKAFEGREPDMVAHVSEVLTKRFYLAASYADYHIYLPRNSAARP